MLGPFGSAVITGLVFGLGFDTATQISAITLSAIASATLGVQVALILAGFFAMGMIPIDTLDSSAFSFCKNISYAWYFFLTFYIYTGRLKENNQSPPPSFDSEQFKTEQHQRWDSVAEACSLGYKNSAIQVNLVQNYIPLCFLISITIPEYIAAFRITPSRSV
ncbi:MAG TPA: hypothetical protein VJ729_14555 [Nitrososphaeraceae archaeon]|nr:hypothetical protein [Nitrososphaeraceae archaeon]